MDVKHITELNADELRVYHKLSEPELLHYYEPEPGLFIAESPMIIERALAAGYEPVSILLEDGSADFTEKILKQSGFQGGPEEIPADIPIYAAPFEELKKITGYVLTRGILCAMRRKKGQDPQQLMKNVKRAVILEDVMNPTNEGAIFRSAAALGMEAVFLTPGCTDPLYRRAARVSMGAVFEIPWAYLQDWPKDMDVFRKHGFRTAAMTLSGSCINLNELTVNPEDKIALIMGTEGPGVREETAAACDVTVKIPMSNGVDSLNVATAAAIAFWHLNVSGKVRKEPC